MGRDLESQTAGGQLHTHAAEPLISYKGLHGVVKNHVCILVFASVDILGDFTGGVMCVTRRVQLVIAPEIAEFLNTAISKCTSGVTVQY